MNRVFLSYNRADEAWVRATLTQLKCCEEYGNPEFTDPAGWIGSDERARDRIRSATRSADVVLLFWSHAAASDPWVHYELGLALGMEKAVRVLLAGGDVPALPPYLADTERVNMPAQA